MNNASTTPASTTPASTTPAPAADALQLASQFQVAELEPRLENSATWAKDREYPEPSVPVEQGN